MNCIFIEKSQQSSLPSSVQQALQDLLGRASLYLSSSDQDHLRLAFHFSYGAHIDHKRADGSPYIVHPIAVSALLADLHLDIETLCAAMLHDTIEDNEEVNEKIIADNFGETVAFLVNSVTKISYYDHQTAHPPEQGGHSGFNDKEVSAANLRHLILSSAKNFRALVIKLADRLHNMRTLENLSETKQQRIADETLSIYAPLASLIGMRQWKNEMEDIAFRTLNPSAYKRISQYIAHATEGVNQSKIDELCEMFRRLLRQKGIRVKRVYGRIKTPYSIMRKTSSKNLTVHELMDIVAFRVIVKNRRDCYSVLGAIHSKYRYLQNTFDDYISEPKGNGYRSLHTVIFFPNKPKDYRIEIQIRSLMMHEIAETGIAAHWRYKNKQTLSPEASEMFFRLQKEAEQDQQSELLMQELDLHSMSEEVIAYTPKGHLVRLQSGATVLDFAFHIHTDVGKRFKEALVDGRNVSMGYKINNGEKIEIITDDRCSPEEFWQNHAESPRAKLAIRHSLEFETFLYFEGFIQDIARQCDVPLLQKLDVLSMRSCFRRLGVKNLLELEKNLERAITLPEEILLSVQPDLSLSIDKMSREKISKVNEIEAENYHPDVLRCDYCLPIPGDTLLGVQHIDKGIIAHRDHCSELQKNYDNTHCFTQDVLLARSGIDSNLYRIALDCQMTHRPGMLGVVATAIGERGVSIQNVELLDVSETVFTMRFYLDVQHKTQIDGIEKTVRARASDMIKVNRPMMSPA